MSCMVTSFGFIQDQPSDQNIMDSSGHCLVAALCYATYCPHDICDDRGHPTECLTHSLPLPNHDPWENEGGSQCKDFPSDEEVQEVAHRWIHMQPENLFHWVSRH